DGIRDKLVTGVQTCALPISVDISKLANRRSAGAANASHFAGGKDDHGIHAFLRSESRDAAGAADQLSALAGVHFDVVDFQAAGRSEERRVGKEWRSRRWADH